MIPAAAALINSVAAAARETTRRAERGKVISRLMSKVLPSGSAVASRISYYP